MKALPFSINTTQFSSIAVTFVDVLQIAILAFAIYYLTKTVYKTRAWILVKGLLMIGAIYLVICLTKMTVLKLVFQSLFSSLMIAIVIMLQPELQRIVELIGTKQLDSFKSLFVKKAERATWYSTDTICEITEACEIMSKEKTGALIVLERGIPLREYIKSGITLHSAISQQLLVNIFENGTPLHDGAVIIQNNKVESATSYLPLSVNCGIDKNLGTRHRAALGISESTDCVVVVVSEETGAISLCVDGKINHGITGQQLSELLQEKMYKGEEKVFEKRQHNTPMWIKIMAPVLGVIIWMSVTITNDPVVSKTVYDIPVSTINTDALDEIGQAYTITNGQHVNVVVEGRRSLVDAITNEDIIATADFEQMSMVYAVPIDVHTTPEFDGVEVEVKNNIMKLQLEEIVQVEVPIEVNIINDDNNDCVVVLNNLDADTISVTAPLSLSKTLDKAVLTIDADNKTTNFIVSVEPVVYDKNGSVLNDSQIRLGTEAVRVFVDVMEVQEKPLEVMLAAQDKNSETYYELNEYGLEKDIVRIAANDEILNSVDKITITVTPDQNSETVGSVMVNLKQCLPEGVMLAKDQDEQVQVDVDLTKYQRVAIPISASSVKITGYDATKLSAQFVDLPREIVLYCDMSLVDPSTITLSVLDPIVKSKQVEIGEYSDVITVTEIEGVSIVSSLDIRYVLSPMKDLE